MLVGVGRGGSKYLNFKPSSVEAPLGPSSNVEHLHGLALGQRFIGFIGLRVKGSGVRGLGLRV